PAISTKQIGGSIVYRIVNVNDCCASCAAQRPSCRHPLRRRCVMSSRQFAALLLLFPLGLGAQTSARPLAVASGGNAAMLSTARAARRAPVCDGSTIRSAKHRAYVGLAMMGASLR